MPTIRDLREEYEQGLIYDTILLIELSGDGEEVFEARFPHNPESFDTEASAKWRPRHAPGVARDVSDFEGFEPRTRQFEWLGESKEPERFENSFLLPLESAMAIILDDTQEAPRVQLLQGAHSMRGHISQLSVKRVRTDAKGYARVAEISMTIVENDG